VNLGKQVIKTLIFYYLSHFLQALLEVQGFERVFSGSNVAKEGGKVVDLFDQERIKIVIQAIIRNCIFSPRKQAVRGWESKQFPLKGGSSKSMGSMSKALESPPKEDVIDENPRSNKNQLILLDDDIDIGPSTTVLGVTSLELKLQTPETEKSESPQSAGTVWQKTITDKSHNVQILQDDDLDISPMKRSK
jgi:hypothetical protein